MQLYKSLAGFHICLMSLLVNNMLILLDLQRPLIYVVDCFTTSIYDFLELIVAHGKYGDCLLQSVHMLVWYMKSRMNWN